MSDAETPKRAANIAAELREGVTVLDEPFHHEALTSVMYAAADLIERQQARIEELEKALRGLLADTQHASHSCTDDDCPVKAARAAIAGVKP